MDLSKNKFSTENIEHFLLSIKSCKNIESLSLTNIGIDNTVQDALIFMLSNQPKLKRFNLSGNNLNSESLK